MTPRSELDVRAIVLEAVAGLEVELEPLIHDKVADALRAQGWTCVPPSEETRELVAEAVLVTEGWAGWDCDGSASICDRRYTALERMTALFRSPG